MTLKPCKNNLLIRAFKPEASAGIILPDKPLTLGVADSQRTKFKVLAVSDVIEDARFHFSVGDFLLLRPDFACLRPAGSSDIHLLLIDASVVEAIVTDDVEPTTEEVVQS